MGQQWDGEGVAFDPETWRIVSAALRGAFFWLVRGAAHTSPDGLCNRGCRVRHTRLPDVVVTPPDFQSAAT
jgi:hypothetical protein